MRKKDDTLRETLLDAARSISDTEGIGAVNIRSIAKKAGIAAGTVYNYFSSKDDILLALTEEYWKQTLYEMNNTISAVSFCAQLQEIFIFLRNRISQSAGKLMNSLGSTGTAGQMRMLSMQSELELIFISRMEQYPGLRTEIWDKTFTKEQFAHFLMINIMLLLKEETPDFDFFLTIVKRLIYESELENR